MQVLILNMLVLNTSPAVLAFALHLQVGNDLLKLTDLTLLHLRTLQAVSFGRCSRGVDSTTMHINAGVFTTDKHQAHAASLHPHCVAHAAAQDKYC